MEQNQNISIRRKKDRLLSFSQVSIGGCSLLILLLIALLCPMTGKVFAEEDATTSSNVRAVSDNTVYDGTTESEVTISFNPTYGSGSVTPVGNLSDTAVVTMQAGVSVQNSGGYSVYLGSSNPNLVGSSDKTRVIPTLPKDVSVTLDNLPTNTWGYYAGSSKDSTGSDTVDTTTVEYRAIASGRGDVIHENLSSKIVSDSMNFILAFAARVDSNMPADTYTNTMTLSVVSNPLKVATFDGIVTMQQMTPDICSRANENDTAYLMDIRDGNKYWVTKLKDGNCWMSQNLALDLVEGQVLTSETTDIPMITNADGSKSVGSWVVPKSTNKEVFTGTTTKTDTYDSWNPGKWVHTLPRSLYIGQTPSTLSTPNELSQYKYAKNVAKWTPATDPNFTNNTTYIEDGRVYSKQAGAVIDETSEIYDAHFLFGNYYQWLAATAGTGKDLISQAGASASGSICPANWHLPTADQNNIALGGSYSNLVSNYGIPNSAIYNEQYAMGAAPLFFVKTGVVNPVNGLMYATDHASYLIATISSNTNMYRMYFMSTIAPFATVPTDDGCVIRCRILSK